MKIGTYQIGDGRCFVIAEIGMNHNGILENAYKLVDVAIAAGVDCVKFQLRYLDQVYTSQALNKIGTDLPTQYTLDLLQKFQLQPEDYRALKAYCDQKGVAFMCTPWDLKSVSYLENIGTAVYKIASPDMTNVELLDAVMATGKPMVVSTGMSNEEEIHAVVTYLKSKQASFALLHSNSTYPTPFKDVNLRYMDQLGTLGVPYGYSGHERGIAVSLAAVARGAQILERHITLDRHMEGPDHAASLEGADFKQLVTGIRDIELALGAGGDRKISQGEMINRDNLGKSLYLNRAITKGEVIAREDVIIRSPGRGVSPLYLDKVVGLTSPRTIASGDCIFASDLVPQMSTQYHFEFKRPWGVPVRPYDVKSLFSLSKPDLVEFHFSYNDLDIPIEEYLDSVYECDFIVHVPELFANDHLLDLCSPDEAYRQISLGHMRRIIEITLKLKPYFSRSSRPFVVIHCGGFSKDSFMTESDKPRCYELLADSLKQLAHPGVELLPENMAPFPWHFGGQRYQNIFVNADEIVQFCNKTGFRICQDISHSHLTCNHFGWSHLEYTRKLAPLTAHYHISDGENVDGEGLQIGKGKIEFDAICDIINQGSPTASFIPEIWQGHKNSGEGFWVSLARLEGRL